ncbi:MAG: phosphoribosylanthranilate isomerase [Acidobacteria bacterium]|nr:phosphoribosylanthranilate isomerase [Acidobacteriota bacterium]
MFLKICGITRRADALHAVEHGATALGFVFWPKSPRRVAPDRAAEIIAALPPGMTTVGVFVNESIDGIRTIIDETGITAVQLHGEEPAAYADAVRVPVLRVIGVEADDDATVGWPPETIFVVDALDSERRGGTGQLANWIAAAALARRLRVVLAGGLTEANVADAIAAVAPYGVDVASGVEDAPGVKNPDKVARFLARARSTFEQQSISHR